MLRSVIDFGDLSREDLILNFQKLLPAKIEWNQPADKTIFEFTRSFFEQRYELPSAQTVEDYLTVRKDQEGLERLKDLEKQNPYVRTNYAHLVANTVTEQNSIRAVSALKQAQEIITKGLIIDDTKLHGLRDGIKHFSSLAPTFVTNEYAAKTTGNLRQDGNEVWTDYLISKANRAIAWGKFCGLNAIDSVVRGIKKGELWIHAASTGEGKCLAGDALVFDHSTHRMRTVKEMFDSGSKPIVDALEDEGFTGSTRLIQAQTEAIVANGEKQVWDLILESGKRIGATSNHGFYTLEGWKSLGDLKPGDFIATQKELQSSGFEVGTGDIRWDRVSDITFRGVEMTYDLSVPRHHSFVANGIVTHNTTFALNWCYNLVTRYKSNVLYVSLEMPYKQLRDKIYAIHSTHPKFAHYGKGLDYEKIKYGLLDPTEERWFQEVANDFGGSVVEVKSADDLQPNPLLNSSDYGSFHVVSPEDDVNMDDIRAMAELKHQEEEIHMVVIDHGLLVEARKKKRNKDTTSEMNSVLRDAKQRLALQFNHGEGMAVLVLFQINREGKAYADKNEGRYRLSALAQANETERSADIVTTSYLNDEHRAAGTMFFDNLKRRDGAHFPPFTAAIYWPSGRLGNLDPFTSGTAATGKGMSIEDMRNVDAILSEL